LKSASNGPLSTITSQVLPLGGLPGFFLAIARGSSLFFQGSCEEFFAARGKVRRPAVSAEEVFTEREGRRGFDCLAREVQSEGVSENHAC
jgi:hypothetical protein